jgi:hypothetical protein
MWSRALLFADRPTGFSLKSLTLMWSAFEISFRNEPKSIYEPHTTARLFSTLGSLPKGKESFF